jgi:hypothetical protein
MQPTDFCYWLQGFSEIHGKRPTEKQWLIIQDHLKLVFNKVTPDRNTNIFQPIYGSNPPKISGVTGLMTPIDWSQMPQFQDVAVC